MRLFWGLIFTICCIHSSWGQNYNFSEKSRLIILADMGNEPDEEQQMMHLLMCSHAFDLEGLIAVTGKFLRPENKNPYKQRLHPERFHHLIEGYSKVIDNLKRHAKGWPEPNYLKSIVASGQSGYGIEATGPGQSSEGSQLIIKSVEKKDPRPIYVVVNAGSNTLAQTIKDYATNHSNEEVQNFIRKLRVFENGAQDNAGAWICHHYPDIHWIRSNYQTYCYGGPSVDGGFNNRGKKQNLGPYTWEPYAYSGIGQHQWALEHIIGNHGPFGVYYPLRQFRGGGISFLEGGGTIPWLCLINQGLSDIEHPHWGGWSGRYSKVKHKDIWSKHVSVNEDEKAFSPFLVFKEEKDRWVDPATNEIMDHEFAAVWRWRRAFFNDFRCRMDWCHQPYEMANHHPIAVIGGDTTDRILHMDVQPGSLHSLDASNSFDPDGDTLLFKWWHYPEAGTYPKPIPLSNPKASKIDFRIPGDADGKDIHIILEVSDQSDIASLFDYRRIVFNVKD